MHNIEAKRKWLCLPSRIALLLGLGAVSAVGAQASTANASSEPQQSVRSFGELLIWTDGDRIFISEAGQQARELMLGDSAEARRLRGLLQREGATADSPRMLQDRMILVGGGGMGVSWEKKPASPNKPVDQTKTGTPDKAGVPDQTGAPEKPSAPETGKKG